MQHGLCPATLRLPLGWWATPRVGAPESRPWGPSAPPPAPQGQAWQEMGEVARARGHMGSAGRVAVAASAQPQLPPRRAAFSVGAGTARPELTHRPAPLPALPSASRHLDLAAGGVPASQACRGLSTGTVPGRAGWPQPLPLSGRLPPLAAGRPAEPGGPGAVGVGAPCGGTGWGRDWGGPSPPGLVWLGVSLTRTSEKTVCPSGRPTGARPGRAGLQAQGGSVVPLRAGSRCRSERGHRGGARCLVRPLRVQSRRLPRSQSAAEMQAWGVQVS